MKIYKNLFLLLFFTHFSTVAQTDTVERTNYTLLWEITSSWQEQPSYLFGTMHVENKEAFRFSDSVLIVFDKVDAVALELNLDTVIQTIFGDAISVTDTMKRPTRWKHMMRVTLTSTSRN
ncbi:MAG: TraB/GumN family protein [Bacteroidetes bacterium]|nr:TraB/GumN family protein [Bacteroidota bacterium]